jgi:hypothetical protein
VVERQLSEKGDFRCKMVAVRKRLSQYFSYFAKLYEKWKITGKGSIHEQREHSLPIIGEVIAPRV